MTGSTGKKKMWKYFYYETIYKPVCKKADIKSKHYDINSKK